MNSIIKYLICSVTALMLVVSFASCSSGGNVEDETSSSVVSSIVSDVSSMISSTMSEVSSDVSSHVSSDNDLMSSSNVSSNAK